MTRLRKKLARWYNTNEKIRRTQKELGALTDKELADIGINRCDIPRVAREGRA